MVMMSGQSRQLQTSPPFLSEKETFFKIQKNLFVKRSGNGNDAALNSEFLCQYKSHYNFLS